MDRSPFPPDCARAYRAVRRLGAGGHGEVWEAEQLALGRRVALKVLLAAGLGDAGAAQRFGGEARITAQLTHPHVVRLLDHGAATGVPWIAFELVVGDSLRVATADGPLAPLAALDAVVQVCDGLDAAHALGILHRDIKPDNLLRSAEGAVKIADFGIAKWSGQGAVKTQTGVILGTPAYIAPEQIQGAPASHASDLYAVAITAFELFTGAPPFAADTMVQVLQAHLHAPVPRASARRAGLPAALDAVFATALAKDPAHRYADARALGAAFAALRDELIAPDARRMETARISAPAPILRPATVTRAAGVSGAAGAAPRPVTRAVHPASPPGRPGLALPIALGAVLAVALAATRARLAAPPPPPTAAAVAAGSTAPPSPAEPPVPSGSDRFAELREHVNALAERNNLSTGGLALVGDPMPAYLRDLERFRRLYAEHGVRCAAASRDNLVFLAGGGQMVIDAATILSTRELVRNAKAEEALSAWRASLPGTPAGTPRALVERLLGGLLDELKRERRLQWHVRARLLTEALEELTGGFAGRAPEPAELAAGIDLARVIVGQLCDPVWVQWSDSESGQQRVALAGRLARQLSQVLAPAIKERAPEARAAVPHLAALLATCADLAHAPGIQPDHAGAAGAAARSVAELMTATPVLHAPLIAEVQRTATLGYRLAPALGLIVLQSAAGRSGAGSMALAVALARAWAAEPDRMIGAIYSDQSALSDDKTLHDVVHGRPRTADRIASRLKGYRRVLQARHPGRIASDVARLKDIVARGALVIPVVYEHPSPDALLRIYIAMTQVIGLGRVLEERDAVKPALDVATRSSPGAAWVAPLLRALAADGPNEDAARHAAAREAGACVAVPPDPGAPGWAAAWTGWVIVQCELARSYQDIHRPDEACAIATRARARLPRIPYLVRVDELSAQVEELLSWRRRSCGLEDRFLSVLLAAHP